MQLFGISKAGFAAISVAVVTLWACIALEAIALGHGRADERAVERMMKRPVPASMPAPPFRHSTVKSS